MTGGDPTRAGGPDGPRPPPAVEAALQQATQATTPVRILLLEDSAIDADLIAAHVRRDGLRCEIERVETREAFIAAVERGGFDLILSDFSLPSFDGMSALELARAHLPQTPFIFVSGVLGEEIAIESLKQGATDYVVKQRLARLPAAVDRALAEARDRAERRRAEERTRLLAAELSHRVRNTLTSVVSIAQQTLRRANSLEAFEEAFMGRLHALANAHAVLLRAAWSETDLEAVVSEALKPFRRDDGRGVEVVGEPVQLIPQDALNINLIVHELATNAAKYGALSVASGAARLEWEVEQAASGPALRLAWSERGGPMVAAPRRKGFGSILIEHTVRYELDGRAEIAFEPTGVVCRLTFPIRKRAEGTPLDPMPQG